MTRGKSWSVMLDNCFMVGYGESKGPCQTTWKLWERGLEEGLLRDSALSSNSQLTHLLESAYQAMGEYCFGLHSCVSACLVRPRVAGVPSYFLWNLWVKVKKTTEKKAITRSKDTEKALEDRILVIEEQYSSYLLPISHKLWQTPFRSDSIAFSNNLKPQKAFSSSYFTPFSSSPFLSFLVFLYLPPLSSFSSLSLLPLPLLLLLVLPPPPPSFFSIFLDLNLVRNLKA